MVFQYRKRYEVTCDTHRANRRRLIKFSFNTASGMRSHVTAQTQPQEMSIPKFQYRKRYEVTCDTPSMGTRSNPVSFQYRKRYEVTCDRHFTSLFVCSMEFQYRKRYEVTCDSNILCFHLDSLPRFNTASGMRSHVTTLRLPLSVISS